MAGWYLRLLQRPRAVLAIYAAMLFIAALFWPQLRFDASSETLVVEGDEAFAAYVATTERFPGDSFVLMTAEPHTGNVFAPSNLEQLAKLQTAAAAVPGVISTTSLLDVPILSEPNRPTLRQAGSDREAARAFFLSNPLFVHQLISEDGKAAAIKVTLSEDASPTGRSRTLAALRALRDNHSRNATVHIGGVPLIADDMIRYVREDLRNFGVAAVSIMTLALWVFFRRLRWVGLCIGTAVTVVALEVGLLAALDIPVSVVSANFISLTVIVTISFAIHLIVRYRELLRISGSAAHGQLVTDTMRSKFAPCLYTALTTIVAFSSLITSGIPPVEDFGVMMVMGVALALMVTYTLFPAALLLLPKGQPSSTLGQPLPLARALGRASVTHPLAIALGAAALLAIALSGLTRLTLDSHFSGYFKANTDIRQGLELIDQRFGGVLPLNVLLQFPPYEAVAVDESDDFFFESDAASDPQSTWFDARKVAAAANLAAEIRSWPEVGSVTSIGDLAALGAQALGGAPLDDVQLAVLVSGLGDTGRASLVDPYANPASGELRLSLRMHESASPARYPEILARIRTAADAAAGLPPASVETTGMYILFGDSVRTLFDSQLNTIVYVLVATLIMFVLLLRSVTKALIGIAANALAAMSVLAIMGYVGLPLDMMTITIAAIAIGIGVDDAIHYLHRYGEERARGHCSRQAVLRCHRSIGRAVYFTSITVILGFAALMLSNFLPTVYFGFLTALAMATALLANLLLLPGLVVLHDRNAGAGIPYGSSNQSNQ